ncbi:MAG: GGDEF domain-containing protein, partial [Acidimicrobiia bacterium]
AGAESGGLLFIDVDDFKSVNDDHGHAVGDEVLIEIGRRIADACGPDDVPARIGGDEFAVLSGRDTDVEELASAIQRAVAPPLRLLQGPDRVSVSVGWVRDVGGDDAFAAAGRAMRRVKRGARSSR